MNSSRNKNPIIRLAGGWWLICLFACCIYGCADDVAIDPFPGDEYATLVLNIKTPGASSPRPVTRSLQTDEETAIMNVKVLVFSDVQGNGTYRFNYMAEGTELENRQDQTSRFQVMLQSSSVPLKLYLVANYGNAFTEYVPPIGADEASVKTSILNGFTSDGLITYLPMYGEISMPDLDATRSHTFDVTVLRAIARVDVVTRIPPGSSAFSLREVHVFRANNQIQLIPDAVITDGTVRVVSPSVPAGSSFLEQAVIKSSSVPTDSIGGIYIPESVSPEQSGEITTSATTVVVGGIFGSDTAISYYRVDFNSGIQGHPFGQVLRNHLYTFTIQRVTGTGLPSAEEAAVNLASSMVVEVRQWEDFTTGMYFHDNYIGVSRRQVDIPFLPDYTEVVDVEASLNYAIQWADSPGSGTVSEAGVPLSNGYFTATIVRDSQESPYLSHIHIESPQYNTTGQPIQAVLRVIANDISLDITVTKESQSQHSGRVISVMSVGGGYGSLGSFNAIVDVTLPMRNILDANFTPSSSYPFNVGGFFFLTVPISDPAYSNATTPAAVASFKKMISSFDVLVMTFENVTSPQVADMLLDEWLVEDPHRVLWIIRDDAASNAAILARTAQDGEGVWNDIGNAFDAAAGYRYSNSTDYAYNNAQEVYEFFNGPFGTIDNSLGQQILRPGDIVSGASAISESAKQYVTPLVYSNKTGYTNYMSVGVNKKRGIVYQGESQFFQYNVGMSLPAYNNGTITATPDTNGRYYYDVLMANIWAWVTGRVIYGPVQ